VYAAALVRAVEERAERRSALVERAAAYTWDRSAELVERVWKEIA
jgi:hypothetical protein